MTKQHYAVVSIGTDPDWDEDDREPEVESSWSVLEWAEEEAERVRNYIGLHEGIIVKVMKIKLEELEPCTLKELHE